MSQFQYDYTDFYGLTGGINTVKSAIALDPSEARDAQDIDQFPIGGITKRNGYTQLNSSAISANSCTGLYMARFTTGGGTNLALLVNDTKIYKMSGSLGGTWTDITGGLTITTGANNIWNFDMLNDIVVLGNNQDQSIQVSSAGVASTLTPLANLTKFMFPVQHRGYMWYFVPTVSGTTFYDRGYFSSIGDPTVVGANNFVDVYKGQGGEVRGAVDFKGFLFVFKRNSICQITYQPTRVDSTGTLFPFTQFPNPIVPGVGTQSHRSIVKFTTPATHATPGEELVFFVDQFGVPRIFDGTTTLSFGSKIGTSRDTTILSLSDMDQTRNPFSFCINYPSKNRILCFMSKVNSQEDTCWVMDYTTGFSFYRYKFALPFNVGCLFENSNGTFKPYVGDYAGKVHQTDTGTTDNGTAISDYYVTGDIYKGSPVLNSKWYWTALRGQTGSNTQQIKTSYYFDGSDAPSLTDTFTLQGQQTIWGSFTWGTGIWSKKAMFNAQREIQNISKTMRMKVESYAKATDTYNIEGWSHASSTLGTSQD